MKEIINFSAGATSTIAAYYYLKENPSAELVLIDIGTHHQDNKRYIAECEEKLFNKKVIILKSVYQDQFDVIERVKFINSPAGASCTLRLKRRVREQFEYEHPEIETYIWGFEDSPKEIKRAEKIIKKMPDFQHKFPLIEKGLTKANCLYKLMEHKIEMPMMYRLGFSNNNCIGCVKGGMGYWNGIREEFPETFERMSELEQQLNHSCIKNLFLKDLKPGTGRRNEIIPECNIFCQLIDKEK